MPNPFEAVGAVNDGSLVQPWIDSCDCCQINNGVPAHTLPNSGYNIDGFEILRLQKEINGFPSQSLNHLIDNASRWLQKVFYHAGDDNDRDKVWKIADSLNDFFKPLSSDFI